MRVIYNLEDFIIDEMFKPYASVIDEKSDTNNCSLTFQQKYERQKYRRKLIEQMRSKPKILFDLLDNNPEAKAMVFNRLEDCMKTWRFYKRLNPKDPIILYVKSYKNLGGSTNKTEVEQ